MGTSGHGVSYWGEDKIQIGCEQNTVQGWIENYEAVGKNNRYSAAQIAEYKSYIDIVAAFHAVNATPAKEEKQSAANA